MYRVGPDKRRPANRRSTAIRVALTLAGLAVFLWPPPAAQATLAPPSDCAVERPLFNHTPGCGPIAAGEKYTGTFDYEANASGQDDDNDFFGFYTDRPNVPFAVHFGNTYGGTCYPFPDSGYDTCWVLIELFDQYGNELIPFGGETVNPGYEWQSEGAYPDLTLDEPGPYYIGIAGSEDFATAGEPDSFQPLPYYFTILPQPGLGVDGPRPPSPPDIFIQTSLFSGAMKHLALIADKASALHALDEAGAVAEAGTFGALAEFGAGIILEHIVLETIIEDPPDPNFAHPVRIRALRLPGLRRSNRKGPAQQLLALQARASGAARAALLAFERFKGAQQAQNRRWMRRHLRTLARASRLWARGLNREPIARIRAAHSLRHARIRYRPAAVRQIQSQIARTGKLPRVLRRILVAAGATTAQLNSFAQQLATAKLRRPNPVKELLNPDVLGALPKLARGALHISREAHQGLKFLAHQS